MMHERPWVKIGMEKISTTTSTGFHIGASHSVSMLICESCGKARATCLNSAPILGTKGNTACPEGSQPIMTLEDCDEARTSLGMGWNAEELNEHGTRFPYCWIDGSGKANFNKYGDRGELYHLHDGSRLICDSGTCQTCTKAVSDWSWLKPGISEEEQINKSTSDSFSTILQKMIQKL
eukprot:gnl/MRDRNA2_/MRDRNA2_40134_c0_seq1.p1 gnl/MRDRNA2_/MRDRNA2_40134_c0~~gnl/MRDRNA2_/MRDRNA2_40134_c0_seq1.p1  ORF type:complete len:178 (+),score=17.31 gnl/MRDRNA2_/MRDRNA2_40134_c0_seq1:80-613(+)